MSTIATKHPLEKAYADFSLTIQGINKDIKFHNIKTVLKIYALIFCSGLFGGFIAWSSLSLALPPLTAFIIAIPLLFATLGTGMSALEHFFIRKKTKDFLKKIALAYDDKIKSFNIKDLNAFGLNCFENGWIPYTVSQIQIDPYDVVKQRYDAKNKEFFSWFKTA